MTITHRCPECGVLWTPTPGNRTPVKGPVAGEIPHRYYGMPEKACPDDQRDD